MPADRFVIELRSLPDKANVPPEVRLTRLLKSARRSFGFAAESVAALDQDDTPRPVEIVSTGCLKCPADGHNVITDV